MNVNTIKELKHTVTYFDIDRSKKLKLSGWFRLFQEVAIRHAEEHSIGAVENQKANTSWVLNRIRCRFTEYPGYKDEVLVKTWSTGVKKFKGYRDFAVYKGDKCIAQASSLWLHIDIDKKAFAKVPQQLVDNFPTVNQPPNFPDVEKTKLSAEGEIQHVQTMRKLRYDDVDSNNHVNNTVYLNLLQTALHEADHSPHPQELFLHFQNEINPAAVNIQTILNRTDDDLIFQIETNEAKHAIGSIAYL